MSVRPWSVDSLNGRSTDELRKALVGVLIAIRIAIRIPFFLFPDRPAGQNRLITNPSFKESPGHGLTFPEMR